jgi:hypothetical protein
MYAILFFSPHVIDCDVALSFGTQIKLSKKSSVKALAKQIKEKLQISDAETVAASDGPTAADNVKNEL